MKILHVITSLSTGGAEMLVVNLMPMFKKMGHEVGVVVFNGERTPLMDRLERECPECEIYRLGTSYYNPWYIMKLVRIMRKYDVVHTHNTAPQLFGAFGSVLCSVVMRHENVLVTTEHTTSNRRRGWKWYVCIDRWMYRRYKRVICISNQAEENLRQYLKREKFSIQTIFNGVDVESFHNAKAVEAMKSEKFVAVMVAGFRYQKDQDTLVKAMEKLPKEGYELWLVGDGDRRKEIETLVRNLNLQDNVKFLGLRTDVAAILKTSDVVVMSSHWEGLSLSNIEGMSAGKPFVASDVDGLREVTDGHGILFPHEDSGALAEIIKRLSEDKEYYQSIANRCYSRAKEFDISEMARRYNEVYLEFS